jgi:transposase
MRYELTDYKWAASKPVLPNKPRGVHRLDDRRILNGVFWYCSPGRFGGTCGRPSVHTPPCYNRFVRWRPAGVWGKIMNTLAGAHDAAVQIIDTSIVRVH